MKPRAIALKSTIQNSSPELYLNKARQGPLRILIADDHDLIRRGVRTLIETHAGWQVCGEARTGLEAVEKAQQLSPDLIVMDVSMPDLNGIEAAKQIQKRLPRIEILVLSLHCHDELIREIVEAGIRGYVIKSDADRDLVTAIEALANHQPFITPVATAVMLTHFNQGQVHNSDMPWRDRLTPRQREIVILVGEGQSTKQVATTLGVSLKTAETHKANIMRKLSVHSIAELVRYGIRNNVIAP